MKSNRSECEIRYEFSIHDVLQWCFLCAIPCKQLVRSVVMLFIPVFHTHSLTLVLSLSVHLILILHCLVCWTSDQIETKQNTCIHTYKKGIIAIRNELEAIRVFRKFDSFSIVAPAPGWGEKEARRKRLASYGTLFLVFTFKINREYNTHTVPTRGERKGKNASTAVRNVTFEYHRIRNKKQWAFPCRRVLVHKEKRKWDDIVYCLKLQ